MTHITMSRRGARADPDNYVVDHVINYASLATRREPAPIANPHPSPFQLDTAWGRRLKRRAHRARSPGECHRHELSQLLIGLGVREIKAREHLPALDLEHRGADHLRDERGVPQI